MFTHVQFYKACSWGDIATAKKLLNTADLKETDSVCVVFKLFVSVDVLR